MNEQAPDFRGIRKDEYLALIEHMKRDAYLFEAGGLLSMGQASERAFGKKNFLELYAVFSSPVLYRVMTEAKRELGSLEQAFVDRLVEDMSAFLLGGRAWLVVSVDHGERLVRVKPAPRGKKPSWGGFVPQFLGREICEEMRGVLVSDEDCRTRTSPEAITYPTGEAQEESLAKTRCKRQRVVDPGDLGRLHDHLDMRCPRCHIKVLAQLLEHLLRDLVLLLNLRAKTKRCDSPLHVVVEDRRRVVRALGLSCERDHPTDEGDDLGVQVARPPVDEFVVRADKLHVTAGAEQNSQRDEGDASVPSGRRSACAGRTTASRLVTSRDPAVIRPAVNRRVPDGCHRRTTDAGH